LKGEDIKIYEGKAVKILLINNFIYSCEVKSIDGDCIVILDKFGKRIQISAQAIAMITPAERGRWQ